MTCTSSRRGKSKFQLKKRFYCALTGNDYLGVRKDITPSNRLPIEFYVDHVLVAPPVFLEKEVVKDLILTLMEQLREME